MSYATLRRRLPAYAREAFRQELSAACAAHAAIGPASLVLYGLSMLLLRDRCGRRVLRARVLQVTPPRPADHHRAAHRATPSVKCELEAKARTLAGLKGYAITWPPAALAVSRWIETRTDWSIRKFVRTVRRRKTIQIQAGNHTITAADPLPDDLRDALHRIHHDLSAH